MTLILLRRVLLFLLFKTDTREPISFVAERLARPEVRPALLLLRRNGLLLAQGVGQGVVHVSNVRHDAGDGRLAHHARGLQEAHPRLAHPASESARAAQVHLERSE